MVKDSQSGKRRLLLRRRRRQSVCSRFVINESLLSPKVGLQLLKRYNKLAETFLVSRNFKIGLNLVLSTTKMKHVKTFNCFNLMKITVVYRFKGTVSQESVNSKTVLRFVRSYVNVESRRNLYIFNNKIKCI